MIPKFCLGSVAGLLWESFLPYPPRGRTVSWVYPGCRGFLLLPTKKGLSWSQYVWCSSSSSLSLLFFWRKGFGKGVGLFAFLVVVVSSFLHASMIEVHFLVSCSPNLSVSYTLKTLGKESESQCEFPLYLGLPGLLYFYASPHLAFTICLASSD